MEILQDSLPPALGLEAQLPGQDYQPEAGAVTAPAAPLTSWGNWGHGQAGPAGRSLRPAELQLSAAYISTQHFTWLPTSCSKLHIRSRSPPGQWEGKKDSAGGQFTPTQARRPGQVSRIASAYFSLLTTEEAWMTTSGETSPFQTARCPRCFNPETG